MLTGLNHLTLAVSEIECSFNFYQNILGFQPKAKWDTGAYLSIGQLWLCLSVDVASQKQDYTHYAFTISEAEIDVFKSRLKRNGIIEWKENRSEGRSVYFLDPDGHKLEVHCGDLGSRLNACRNQPYQGMVFF
nr:fosfomycin resistance glutathione transferase [Acinetobacter sp. Marseille-Q1620]